MSLDGWFERAFGDTEPARPGTGWISGVLSVFLGALGIGAAHGKPPDGFLAQFGWPFHADRT